MEVVTPVSGLPAPVRDGASSINKASGLISMARLNMLPCVHLPPIYLVVFQEAPWEYLSWSVLRA